MNKRKRANRARRIITYGTFDLFHIGHLNLLRRIKSMASEVVVAVSTDEFCLKKGKRTIIPFEQRIQIVESIRHVDHVIAEDSWEQKATDIQNLDVDVFVMGNDWEGKFDFLEKYCEVVYLDRTVEVSSSDIRASLNRLSSVQATDFPEAFKFLEVLKREFK